MGWPVQSQRRAVVQRTERLPSLPAQRQFGNLIDASWVLQSNEVVTM